jgi:ribosomal protein S18 acetylase RimI-like enzyme
MASKDFSIRAACAADREFLREMLYQSLYVPAGGVPFPRDVVARPELAKYVEGWGRAGDLGFIAVGSGGGEPVGAAWLRLLAGDERGYGHLDDETPELALAVVPGHRGRGVGTALLGRLLEAARDLYESVSLSVSSDNPAVRLYERAGFERATPRGASVVMIKRLRA